MGEALVDAIGDGAIGKQRGKDLFAGAEQMLAAADVEIGLLLAGKRCAGQVFGGGGAAHGDIGVVAVFLFQLAIGLLDLIGEVWWQFAVQDPAADLGTGGGEGAGVMGIQAFERSADLVVQLVVRDVVAIGVGSGGKTIRDLDPLRRQRLVHLAE